MSGGLLARELMTVTRTAEPERTTVALRLPGQPPAEQYTQFQSAVIPLSVEPGAADQPPAEPTQGLEGTAPTGKKPTADLAPVDAAAPTAPLADAPLEQLLFTVSRGDSLYTIFEANDLPQTELAAILATDREVKERLSRLQPGHQIALRRETPERIESLIHFSGATRALELVRRESGGFEKRWVTEAPPAASTRKAAAKSSAPTQTLRPAEALALGIANHQWSRHSVRVAKGDSLYTIFLAEKLAPKELVELLRSGEEAKGLKRLLPGQRLDFCLDGANALQHVVYHADDLHSVQFLRGDSGFHAERVEVQVERRLSNAAGEIESSLFLAAQRAGLEDRIIMELVEIFGWDVDFALDIRAGDHFSLIYEELYNGNQKVRDGAILAAEFVNQGRIIRAVRYVNPKGRAEYFTPEGFSMRKAFLRTPVEFTRISSRFGLRKHPVLHKLRRHNGVDYAAPRGTPVKASGDGKVVYLGRKGGYGKTIILRHGSTYTTLYAHLHRYKKVLKRGHAVRQGQIIGYVGSTGLATGPHLHYEFQVRGTHRDPLKVELPKAAPIAAQYKADFLDSTRDILAKLELVSATRLASSE